MGESIVLIFSPGYKKNHSLLTFCPSLWQLKMLIYFKMCLGSSTAQNAGRARVRSYGSIQEGDAEAEHVAVGA